MSLMNSMKTKLKAEAGKRTIINKKGVINIVELTIVVITLFVSFSIFFPRADYKNRWEDAYMILKARDIILLLERTGNLHTYAFEPEYLPESLKDFFREEFESKNLILWSETEGTIKNEVIVACNCTREQIDEMNFWYNGLKINERNVDVLFVQSLLESIPQETDVLLIRDYKHLDPYYFYFKDYVDRGVGIVEMMDFPTTDEINNDRVQKEIFGLQWIETVSGSTDQMVFERKPKNSTDIIYTPYKYFYHIPFPLDGSSTQTITGCDYQPSATGNLTLGRTGYPFWICSVGSVWFDTDADGIKNKSVNLGEGVVIGGYNFTLSYINDNKSISLSFRPDYIFSDFLSYIFVGRKITHIEPIPIDDKERILITGIKGNNKYPAVILNSKSASRVAWIPDFDRDGASDDEKHLLLSLLTWASNKRTSSEISNIKTGYMTSYVNIKNIDMLEVYKFSLGLGYPF